jgi:hypothetical protein
MQNFYYHYLIHESNEYLYKKRFFRENDLIRREDNLPTRMGDKAIFNSPRSFLERWNGNGLSNGSIQTI